MICSVKVSACLFLLPWHILDQNESYLGWNWFDGPDLSASSADAAFGI